MVSRDKKPHRVTRDEGSDVIVSAYPVDHHDATNHCAVVDAMQALAADRRIGLRARPRQRLQAPAGTPVRDAFDKLARDGGKVALRFLTAVAKVAA